MIFLKAGGKCATIFMTHRREGIPPAEERNGLYETKGEYENIF